MTLLARLIAQEEGFYVSGSKPNRLQNPGDLRHSPHASHVMGEPNGIGKIDSVADGWADLERQLQLYASRGMTLRDAIYEFAPPTENDSEHYLMFVCDGLRMNPNVLVSEALKIA